MSVAEVIAQRGITEVLHFTTAQGLVGVLDKQALLARPSLSRDQRLEFILKLNTPVVKDHGWEHCLNLSISDINRTLYGISQRWHPGASWRVLSFRPEILTHEDVFFSTTNNVYPAARRGKGAQGLKALFADVVLGRYNAVASREADMDPSRPTDPQAEVLYPRSLPTEYLQRIYVPTDDDLDEVHAQLAALNHPGCEVSVNAPMFTA